MTGVSVRAKLTLGFGVLVVITLVLGGGAYRSIVVIDNASDEVDRKTTERFLADSLEIAALQAGLDARRFLLTGAQDALESYESARRDYQQTLESFSSYVRSDEGKRLLAEVKRCQEAYMAVADREIQLKRARKEKDVLAITRTQAVPAFDALHRATDELKTHLITTKQAIDKQQDANVATAKLMIVILSISGVVLGVVVAFLISRSVSGSVAKLISTIQELAANNLAVEDLEMRPDEIGNAGLALNRMKNGLRSMIESIAETAAHVASASEEISASAEQQAQTSTTQKDQTAQVASALQEMNTAVMQVSGNSSKASEASRKAAETARHGGSIVDHTLSKMKIIAESVRSTATRVEKLGKSSDQIGRIIGVINDIADQTNLLALNAAIEAARAGEQGRGFAVVADEVRKLAERTTNATKEIANMIEAVQKETQFAVSAMKEGTKQVEEGVHSTNQAGEALMEIIHMSEQVGDMITQIATAAAQQSTATEHINDTMDQIASAIRESAHGAQQSAEACQSLSRHAFELQQMVLNFKLNAPALPGGSPARASGARSGSDRSHKAMAAGAS